MLRVLMVNTYQTGGGAGRVGELLAEELRRAGDDVRALVRHNPGRRPYTHRAGHWREARLAGWLASAGLTDLGGVSSLLWRWRTEYAGADVLHWHNLHGDYISLPALPLWGRDKPVVWTIHDFWPLTGNCAAPRGCSRWQRACGRCPLVGVYPVGPVDRTRFYRKLKPALFVAARPRLVTPSRWLAERVREIPELRRLPLRVIRNPVDCDAFQPSPDRMALRSAFGLAAGDPLVVMVSAAWSDPFKGGADAIAALRRAAACCRGLQLLVVGLGSESILSAVRVPGRALPAIADRRELARVYASGDVCLFPSRAETCGLVALEALACATPVVAYDVGGIPEQVQHGRTGLLARDGRHEELAAAIVDLVRAPAAAQALGRAGRDFVTANCRPALIARQYRDEYRRAIRTWCQRRRRPHARLARGRLARWGAAALGWEESRVPSSEKADSERGTENSQLFAGLPLISVVTPSYNQGRFIERCIRSVLEQNYPNFEHIVYDNCSTDQTLEVLRRYPHVNWVSEPDGGQSDALNKGLRKARGEIIAWLNADDYYLPGAFDLVARELRRPGGVSVLAGGVQLVGADGRVQQTFRPHFEGLDHMVEFWKHPYGLCQPGVFFRREVLERVGHLRTDLHYAMDYDFWLRLAKHYPIRIVDAVLAGYVVHPASKTGSAVHGRGFAEELERVSRRYWGPWWTRRRCQRARACRKLRANMLAHALVARHRQGTFDWSAARQLLLRRPLALLRRPLAGVVAEHALRWIGIRRWRGPGNVGTGERLDGEHLAAFPRCHGQGTGRVTVVIPTYNRAHLLGRAIRSVLSQTARDRCDIVVVDDGSTDQTQAVVAEFGDEVIYLRQRNAGAAAARNAGIRARPNEFIAFLDSDDEWLPEKVERQLEVMRRYANISIVSGVATFARPDGTVSAPDRPNIPLDEPFDIAPYLFERSFLATPSVMVRSACLTRTGLFHTGLTRCEDYHLWTRLACRGRGLFLSTPLARYDRSRAGLTADNARLKRDELWARYLLRAELRLRPDCRPHWQRGLAELLRYLRDQAVREGRYLWAARFGFRSLMLWPYGRRRWEWARLLADCRLTLAG